MKYHGVHGCYVMVITSGNCIVPLALWNSQCPQHRISCIFMTPDRKHLVSGGEDGHVIKWDINKDWEITPALVLMGHEARVTSLCMAYMDEEKSYFVSSTETGEMCLWDLKSGRCVLHKTNSRFIHTSIKSHVAAAGKANSKGKASNLRLLFCCGRYPMLVVMEALSLTPLFHLSSRSNPTRFTALTVFPYPGQTTDVILALSANQVVTVWTIGAGDEWPSVGTAQDGRRAAVKNLMRRRASMNVVSDTVRQESLRMRAPLLRGATTVDLSDPIQAVAPATQKFENESKTIICEGGQIVSMCCCPTSPRTVLIVSQRTWQVHDAVDWCMLCSHVVDSEKSQIEWTGGEFISLDTVLIFSSDGGAKVFKLPVCAIAEQDKFRLMKENDRPQLIAVLETEVDPVVLRRIGSLDSDSSTYGFGEETSWETPKFAFFYDSPMLVRGDADGRLMVWPDVTRICDPNRRRVDVVASAPPVVRVTLEDAWTAAEPRGLVDSLLPRNSSGQQASVTASTFAQEPGKFVLGLESGDILVASILHCVSAVFFSSTCVGPVCHLRLSGGHTRAVTALCYPANRLRTTSAGGEYPAEMLVSGGADFTLRLWDLHTGSHIMAFSGHGAPIMAIVSTPEQCSRRIQECVCSIAADHSISLFNLRERKLQLMANLQPGPIAVVKWRPLEDFMLVGCLDGSLFVWETSSGHLDRYIPAGPSATAALNASEHPYHIPARLYRRHHLRIDRLASTGGGCRMRTAARGKIPVSDLRPLKVQCVRGTSPQDQGWHVLFFDTEALVAKLLSELAGRKPEPASPRPRPRRQPSPARPPRPAEPPSLLSSSSAPPEADGSEVGALDLSVLLVSLLHAWNLDPGLDKACEVTLGFVRPRRFVHYASVNHSGFLSLMVPRAERARPYWRVSAHLTTQHLLSVVSLSNTLMQIVDGSRMVQWPMLCDKMGNEEADRTTKARPTLGGVKQSWSLVTAHHCVLLPELESDDYKAPRLVTLARKWQDRCIEVRQAAQALLLSELRRIGASGRQALLSHWSRYLPVFNEAGSTSVSNLERLRLSSVGSLDEELSALQLEIQPNPSWGGPPVDHHRRGSAGNISNGVASHRANFVEAQRLQALAVVLLGVIGAEFGSASNDASLQSRSTALEGFGRDDYHLARRICKALIALVLPGQAATPASTAASSSANHQSGVVGSRTSTQGSSGSGGNQLGSGPTLGAGMSSSSMQMHTAMRRAAMDLFGRGFAVWEPYIDVTALLTSLLDYSLASMSSSDEMEQIINGGGSLSPSADTARTARHALDLIASSRPRVFILTLSREVKRYNSVAANSQLAGSAAPTAMAIYAARSVILKCLETLCEKRVMEVAEVVGEMVEVLLHCLDYSNMKEWSLRELFPQIARFPNVSSSLKTQKIAVGTRNGALYLYDFKQGKFNTIGAAHSGHVSCLSFHSNGKHVASFSNVDCILRVWQLGTANLFGMVGTQLRCVTQRPLHASRAGENITTPELRGSIFIEWLDNRSVALYTAGGMLDKMRVL